MGIEAENQVKVWGMLFEMLVKQIPCENIKRSEFRAINWESLAHNKNLALVEMWGDVSWNNFSERHYGNIYQHILACLLAEELY